MNTATPLTVEDAANALQLARQRTSWLTDLDEPELLAQHSTLMSPLVWDLAHIGQQEELWLLRGGDGARPGMLPASVESLYDAFEHPRAVRPALPLLPPVEARSYAAHVRARVLDQLDRLPSTREAVFPYAMVAQHEEQHDETMLAALQLRAGPPVLTPSDPAPRGRPVPHDAVLVPGGPCVIGADELAGLDNEHPAHVVDVPAFRIGRVPVTNAEWAAFVADGGYDEPRWWSERGWAYRRRLDRRRPLSWSPDGARTRFGVVEDIPGEEPAQHVSYFEASAYAAWAGARLPTEIEWEKACAWDPSAGRRRRWPWGLTPPSPSLANLGGGMLRPAAVGAYPSGASAYGVEQMIGDVWEWTSSGFQPWPGFTPMLYARYSEPFFGGDYRVLRGGSWATAATSVRPSFRNWDHPYRRQIFTGVRLAWDVPA
ncbi:MAG: Iron(II)-dependent oxidoreductase EgtB (hercynine sythase) [uncultured Nocardioidaceae bacterium]|uniref:Hercynine oxygenase n=1 Tax=uncultured Nocardioidaceae bacterium TaxID=253824 RepID=A0A6J4M2Q9_9ACTN|nr:MAG: Iron(II)-dependent oxidoreductase EgtB (hercynine sythase) [uncultured Nocardioidaceae bacterium]